MEGSQANNHGNKAGKGKTTKKRTFSTNNLMSIMERALPPNTPIHQDAVDAVDRCVTEFAAMLTVAAAEQRKKECRGVMSADDLIKAMEKLGYDQYVGPLANYLHRYRESKGTVRLCGQKRAMAAVAQETGEMEPQLSKYALGMIPEDTVGTREMPPTAPYQSKFTLGPMMYDFMVQDLAPAAAIGASMTEMAPQPSSDTSIVQPLYDFMVPGSAQVALAALATGEKPPTPPRPSDFTLGLPQNRYVRADACAASTSRVHGLPVDDE